MVEFVATLIILTIGLLLLIRFKPELTRTQGGKMLAFVALFILPVATIRAGFRLHYEESKTVAFCVSCHAMEPYGESLLLEDESYLHAAHFQNRRVERRTACFDCHTRYTLFGDLQAKMNGLKHLYANYTGQAPDQIEHYGDYLNRECMYCHAGGRSFEEIHDDDMASLVSDEVSCMDCHGNGSGTDFHDVESLPGAEKWTRDPEFRELPTVQELLELSR